MFAFNYEHLLILVRRLGNHNMPRATFRFYPGIPEWVDSDALSDSRRCTRIGAKPHEHKKKTGGLSCPKVWLVTGRRNGLGRNIVEAVLASGDRLVATARDPRRLEDLVKRYGDQ